jgi:hypothetical protein
MNVFNGTTAGMWALANGAPAPAPKPAPAPAPKPAPKPTPPASRPSPQPVRRYPQLTGRALVSTLYRQSRTTLRPGASGPAVAAAQQVLGLPRTGTFSPAMGSALARWQRAHHLRATGVLDPRTWWTMIAVTHGHRHHRG